MKIRSGIDSIQRPDGSIATSDQEKAELLNSYVASAFTDENLASFPLIVRSFSTQVRRYNYNCFSSIQWVENIQISRSSKLGPTYPTYVQIMLRTTINPTVYFFNK